MHLKEVFSRLRTLAQQPSADQAQVHHGAQTDSASSDHTGQAAGVAGADRIAISRQKFQVLQEYFKIVGQDSNPFVRKMLEYVEGELKGTAKEVEAIELTLPSEDEQRVLNFLDQLVSIPLEHERRLDSLREQLSANNQQGHAPETVDENSRKSRYRTHNLTDKQVEPQHISLPESFDLPAPKKVDPLTIPDLDQIRELSGELSVSIPIDSTSHPDSIDATKQEDAKIDPAHPLVENKVGRLLESDYLADYGVEWDITKCIRDLYQNFSDSHGLTLEGVTVRVYRENKDSPYVVRIEGMGEFNPECVEKTGATTKKGATDTAGGFGEGAKILSLVLLRDHDVDQIRFSSRNWAMDYHIGDFASGKRGLFRKLDLVEDREGNYLELTTTNPRLVESLFQGLNLFYHPQNGDFHNATYENEIGGFKYLGRHAKGNAYPMRQRYQIGSQFESEWDGGLKQISVWTNKKTDKWSPDRDRTAISENTVTSQMIHPIIESMSDEDLIKSIKMLEEFWTRDLACYQQTVDKGELFSLHSTMTKKSLIQTILGQQQVCSGH